VTAVTRTMEAVVHDRYGPPEVLRLEEVDAPTPGAGELLVRVRATTLTRTDCHVRAASPFIWRFVLGVRRPKERILGIEFAGEVEAIGADAHDFEVGDRVFGMKAYLSEGFRCHAELVCARSRGLLAHMPPGAAFVDMAAVCDGGLSALGALRTVGVGEEKRVLVYGASGSIGTAAVQVAKHLGADVTAVCNTPNVEVVRSLGADHVVDYLEEDFTKNGETYDVVFDAVGKHSFRRSRHSLKPGGVFLETDLGFMWHVPLLALATRWIGDKRVTLPVPRYTKEDVLRLKELIETGRYRAVIDRVYPLEEIVEATRYVETGQKTGNVVLTLDHASLPLPTDAGS
jgi:NADPH:quinone reductase-like Zn-dependent oxidoreductase